MGAGIRTTALLGVLTGLLLAIGYIIGYLIGAPIYLSLGVALGLAMFLNFFTYWSVDKWALKLYKARIVDEKEAPELHEIVGELAENAGLPKPKVAIVPSDTPNAFATGRNPSHAVVAVTQGAMKLLDREQLEGVLGHEMAHIKHHDILISTMAAMIAGAIAYLGLAGQFGLFYGHGGRRDSGGGLLALLAILLVPLAASLVRLSVSRTREYGADEEGAKISQKPKALASALLTIESALKQHPMRTGNPSTSHMFIINPFKGVSMMELFSTHPPTHKRVQRLEELAKSLES